MYALIAFNRRAVSHVSIALAAATLLGACDSDRSLAPAPTVTVPEAEQPVINASLAGSIEWAAYLSTNGQKLLSTGSTYRVTGYRSSIDVTDNGPNDANPMLGRYKAAGLTPGAYQVCQTSVPSGSVLATPACHQLTVAAGKTTTDEFVYKPAPIITFDMKDLTGTRIGGGTVVLKDSLGNVVSTAKDNYWPDLDGIAGAFKLIVPGTGKFSMCPSAPPIGYSFWAQGLNLCKTFSFNGGTVAQIGTVEVFPLPSVYWQVTDGTFGPNGYTLIGTGAYTVKIPNGSFAITVVDNNTNDMHPGVGKVFVKLPKIATYEICEVRPPTGYKAAQPACRLVSVVATDVEPKWGGWFTNPKL